MTDDERDKKINALYQAVLGIPGTADSGMVGDIKNLRISVDKAVNHINKEHNRLKQIVYVLIGVLGAGGLLTGGGIGLAKLLTP